MNTVQRWHLVTFEITGSCNIRSHHAFLNHLVRIIAYQWDNALDLAVLAENNACLGCFKVDGAPLATLLAQALVQAV